MNIRIIIVLLLLTCTVKLVAQTDSLFIPARTYPGDMADFTVDNLGNLYILYQNGQLKKLNPQGDSMAVFNDVRRYGRVFSFDVTNPLKVLLYYKDFGTILILDRFLNARSTLDLRRQSLFQVKAIAQAYDNNIWVFDELESRLKRIGDDGRLVDQSADFRMIFDSMPSPQFIVDQNRQVFLYDKAKGIYIFDYYGSFKSRIPFTGWSDFTVINNTIFGRDQEFLYRYEPGSLNLRKFKIPSAMKQAKKIIIAPGSLYTMSDKDIRVYSYN